MKILVIDDSKTDCDILRELVTLSSYNAEVLCVESVGEALTLENGFSIIFLDYELDGLSGSDAFRAIQKHFASTPVISITAHNDRRVQFEMLASGVTHYVSKIGLDEKKIEDAIYYATARQLYLNKTG